MRVIAGALRGRRLNAPTWSGLRPTSDRLRETLFDVLAGRVVNAAFVDGYAGTGAVGIEALSRGASHVAFVEADSRAAKLIQDNLQRCGLQDGYTILRSSLHRAWRRINQKSIDLIFLDPPYDCDNLEDVLDSAAEHLTRDGLIVLEHSIQRLTGEPVAGLKRDRQVSAGNSALSFYHSVAGSLSADVQPAK